MFHEKKSKTNNGGLRTIKHTTKSGEIFSIGGSNCPVRLVKLYISKLPQGAKGFYCKPLSKYQPGKWYGWKVKKVTGHRTITAFQEYVRSDVVQRTASNALASPMYSPDQPHCSKTNVQTRNVVEKAQKNFQKDQELLQNQRMLFYRMMGH